MQPPAHTATIFPITFHKCLVNVCRVHFKFDVLSSELKNDFQIPKASFIVREERLMEFDFSGLSVV